MLFDGVAPFQLGSIQHTSLEATSWQYSSPLHSCLVDHLSDSLNSPRMCDHPACSLLLVRQSTRLEDGDGFFQVRTSGRQIVAVAAQQTPGAMGTGDLWEHFACLKRLETGRQMFLDFVPTRWGKCGKGLAPYPLGQALSVFAVNGVGVDHCLFRKAERFLNTMRAEDHFSAGGGKPIAEDEPLLAKTLGQLLLLGHTRQSSVLLA